MAVVPGNDGAKIAPAGPVREGGPFVAPAQRVMLAKRPDSPAGTPSRPSDIIMSQPPYTPTTGASALRQDGRSYPVT